MARAFVTSIEVVGDGEYAVTFSTADGSKRTYVFTVSGTTIPVLAAPDDFRQVWNHNMMKLRDVYGAVLAMHKATRSEIDLDPATNPFPEG